MTASSSDIQMETVIMSTDARETSQAGGGDSLHGMARVSLFSYIHNINTCSNFSIDNQSNCYTHVHRETLVKINIIQLVDILPINDQNECSVESLPPVAVLELPDETAAMKMSDGAQTESINPEGLLVRMRSI